MRASRVGEIQDRFWSRVDKSDPDGCWNWIGAISKTGGGYGVISGKLFGVRYVPPGQNILAHRVSWIMANGPIPDSPEYHGTVVMHKCDNPRCVNPTHLELGTQKLNVQDMDKKGRRVVTTRVGTKHHNAVFTDEQVQMIRSSSIGTVALAKQLGVDRHAVQRARYGKSYAEKDSKAELMAVPRVRTGLKGGDNPASKLTDELVIEIRQSKLSAVKWAEKIGCHAESVRNARRRVTFKHIP